MTNVVACKTLTKISNQMIKGLIICMMRVILLDNLHRFDGWEGLFKMSMHQEVTEIWTLNVVACKTLTRIS